VFSVKGVEGNRGHTPEQGRTTSSVLPACPYKSRALPLWRLGASSVAARAHLGQETSRGSGDETRSAELVNHVDDTAAAGHGS
jgi:hypothetical protein